MAKQFRKKTALIICAEGLLSIGAARGRLDGHRALSDYNWESLSLDGSFVPCYDYLAKWYVERRLRG